jgi:hypothetical protein
VARMQLWYATKITHSRDAPTPLKDYGVFVSWSKEPREGVGPHPAFPPRRGAAPFHHLLL